MNQEMNQGKSHLAFLLLFLTPMFWGGAFVAAKYVVPELHPVVAASVRFLLCFLFLFPVLMFWEGPKPLPALRDVPLLMFLGLTGIFTYNVLFFYGLQTSQAAGGALVVVQSGIYGHHRSHMAKRAILSGPTGWVRALHPWSADHHR